MVNGSARPRSPGNAGPSRRRRWPGGWRRSRGAGRSRAAGAPVVQRRDPGDDGDRRDEVLLPRIVLREPRGQRGEVEGIPGDPGPHACSRILHGEDGDARGGLAHAEEAEEPALVLHPECPADLAAGDDLCDAQADAEPAQAARDLHLIHGSSPPVVPADVMPLHMGPVEMINCPCKRRARHGQARWTGLPAGRRPAATSQRGRGQRPSASPQMPGFHRAANSRGLQRGSTVPRDERRTPIQSSSPV